MTRMFVRGAAIAVAGVLVLAGCGDDESSAPPESETTIEAETTTTEPEPAEMALSEPAADLAAAITCPEERQYPDAPGVLLVPGTGLDSETTWSLTLGAALPAEGFDICTVDLLETATGDIQRSAEYVVAALRAMADDGYDEVAVVGFSQGVLAARWALTWWPDVQAGVVDLVSIAGPSGGASATSQLCAGTPCAAALQQMTPGSMFLTALDDAWPSVTDIPVTLIASESDTVITVEEVDAVEGGELIVIQDVCADRSVDHVPLLADGVAFAIVLDALTNDGAASAERLDAAVCDAADIGAPGWDATAVNDGAFGAILGATPVAEEPALAAYAAG